MHIDLSFDASVIRLDAYVMASEGIVDGMRVSRLVSNAPSRGSTRLPPDWSIDWIIHFTLDLCEIPHV